MYSYIAFSHTLGTDGIQLFSNQDSHTSINFLIIFFIECVAFPFRFNCQLEKFIKCILFSEHVS